jgi:chromosome segregation ATPase
MKTLLTTLLLALALAIAGWFYSYSSNSELKTQLHNAQSDLASKQLESDGLAAELVISEQTLQSLLFDKSEYERLLKNYELQISRLRNDSQLLTDKIAKLRVSENEQTRTWSNTAVPDDARRLLQQALHTQNRDSQQVATSIAATKPVVGLPSSRF